MLRYEVHLIGFPQVDRGLRSLRLLIGTLEQCQRYAQTVESELRAPGLSIRVRPSGGSSIFLDPEQTYPQEVRSLRDVFDGSSPTQKEAQR